MPFINANQRRLELEIDKRQKFQDCKCSNSSQDNSSGIRKSVLCLVAIGLLVPAMACVPAMAQERNLRSDIPLQSRDEAKDPFPKGPYLSFKWDDVPFEVQEKIDPRLREIHGTVLASIFNVYSLNVRVRAPVSEAIKEKIVDLPAHFGRIKTPPELNGDAIVWVTISPHQLLDLAALDDVLHVSGVPGNGPHPPIFLRTPEKKR